VVILGTDAAPGTAARLLEDGAAGYLKKPLDLPQFFGLLDKVIR
jgi:CheY-like chemotaxis protein